MNGLIKRALPAMFAALLIFPLASEDAYRIIRDTTGRSVRIPAEVHRIGCLYAFTAHVVTMLGQGNEIEAVVNGSKRDKLLTGINPHILDAGVPSDNGIINMEELLKLHLDVVFIKKETAQIDGEREKLERFAIPYVIIDYRTMEEQRKAIDVIGEAINRQKEAEAYNRYYIDTLKQVGLRLSSLKESEKVRVFHSINEASRTDEPGSLGAQWTKAAGLIDVSINDHLRLYDNKHFASLEQIYLWNPDAIIYNEDGVGDYIMNSDKWGGLKAVRDGKVFQIPVGISRWGHPGGMETPLAVLWAACKFYPDRFADLDFNEEVRNFYSTFFRFTPDDSILAEILAGKGMRLPRGKK